MQMVSLQKKNLCKLDYLSFNCLLPLDFLSSFPTFLWVGCIFGFIDSGFVPNIIVLKLGRYKLHP